jgi:hypothetical protein
MLSLHAVYEEFDKKMTLYTVAEKVISREEIFTWQNGEFWLK